MAFSSEIFLFIFLPIALVGYRVTPKGFRNIYLLLISIAFYAWNGLPSLEYFLGFIFVNYLFGILLSYTGKHSLRANRAAIFITIAINLGGLIYSKYTNFFSTSINGIAGTSFPVQTAPLLLGISFFTFSAISYLFDIYYGKITAEKNLLNFALYIAFFPKLLQGPISRFADVNAQIQVRESTSEKFAKGIIRFTIGLAKKLIIADQLGIIVDQIFQIPAGQNSIQVAWLGAISYTMQIYFDFSGYSDMAIGLGKMFGFDLMENFNFPYISTSISEFWRRWHISLSTWFREYVFYPLEFKRRKTKILRTETDTLIVFFLTGLWHGASWSFVLWGLWHGLFITWETFLRTKRIKIKVPTLLKYLGSMTVVILGWVLFRSKDINYAITYIGIMLGIVKPITTGITLSWYFNAKIAIILIIAIAASVPWNNILYRTIEKYKDNKGAIAVYGIAYMLLLIISIMFAINSSYNAFIYFKF